LATDEALVWTLCGLGCKDSWFWPVNTVLTSMLVHPETDVPQDESLPIVDGIKKFLAVKLDVLHTVVASIL
jgi:hypothetical protein